MSILSELLGAKHREQLLQKQYKLESARQMIESEAREPGTFDPKMIQLAADTLQMGVVPKEHEGGFHRALGAVLPHIFGKKAPEKPANEGALSSAGSAAPQAAMMPPPMPPPATAEPGATSPILSLNAPQAPLSPPPGAAPPPMSPLPASLGQAGSGVGAGPAAPSDTTAPQPLPGIRSDPGQGWASVGITPSTTTPPPAPVQPAGPLLRHGTQQVPFHVNTLAERVQANAPGMLAKAGLEAQVNAQRYAQMKARLEGEDWYKALSPRQKATVLTGQSITPEFRPTNLPGMVHGKDIPDSTVDAFGNPVDKDSMYRMRLSPDGTREYFPEVGTTTTKVIPDEGSPTKFSLVFLDRTGHEVSRTTGATPPAAFAPTTSTSTSNVTKLVTDAQGNIHAVPVTNTGTTTRRRNAIGVNVAPPPNGTAIAAPPGSATQPTATSTRPPAAGAGSPGRIVGARPLAPAQRINFEAKMGAVDNTLELAKRVQTNLSLVNGLLDAKKIDFVTDPQTGFIHAAISRALPLSPKEAELAGDISSLMEHINTLRGPLGATGFRGQEAWSALQAQRGNLMGNPAVTKRVLSNTITALRTQRDAFAKGLGSPDAPPSGNTGDDWKTRAVSAKVGEIIDTPRGKVRKDGPNSFTPVP